MRKMILVRTLEMPDLVIKPREYVTKDGRAGLIFMGKDVTTHKTPGGPLDLYLVDTETGEEDVCLPATIERNGKTLTLCHVEMSYAGYVWPWYSDEECIKYEPKHRWRLELTKGLITKDNIDYAVKLAEEFRNAHHVTNPVIVFNQAYHGELNTHGVGTDQSIFVGVEDVPEFCPVYVGDLSGEDMDEDEHNAHFSVKAGKKFLGRYDREFSKDLTLLPDMIFAKFNKEFSKVLESLERCKDTFGIDFETHDMPLAREYSSSIVNSNACLFESIAGLTKTMGAHYYGGPGLDSGEIAEDIADAKIYDSIDYFYKALELIQSFAQFEIEFKCKTEIKFDSIESTERAKFDELIKKYNSLYQTIAKTRESLESAKSTGTFTKSSFF